MNTYEFCTLFDVNYLPRGLALYRSLERTCDNFRLRVFCMDAESERILGQLALPRLAVIGLDELEAHDRELLEVKPTRTQIEYCWTATPAVCAYVLETEPEVDGITYLDADLMFFRSPEPLFEEMGNESVLIVPHRYAPRWRHHEPTSGIFNVEFMTFRRDGRGLEALHWWRERCIEWCYYRFEDGKMGDQKYLDDWPERFDGVHVLEHPGGGLAPWNVDNYELARRNGSVLVDDRDLVFYHYHSLRVYRGISRLRALGFLSGDYRYTGGPVPMVWTTDYPLNDTEQSLVWDPYLRELGRALQHVRRYERDFAAGFVEIDGRALAREAAARIARTWLGRARRGLASAKRLAVGRRDARIDGWKDAHAATQMLELARVELEKPTPVPPHRSFLEAIDYALTELGLPEPARVLDFGCGVGHYSELLERHYPGRFLYTGCDFSEAMVETARAEWPGRAFVVNDLFANTLDLGSFDLVLAGALVNVTNDHERALEVLLSSSAPLVLLHRVQLTQARSHVEVVPGYAGRPVYRSYLNRSDLDRIAGRHARRVLTSFHVADDVHSFLFGASAQ